MLQAYIWNVSKWTWTELHGSGLGYSQIPIPKVRNSRDWKEREAWFSCMFLWKHYAHFETRALSDNICLHKHIKGEQEIPYFKQVTI